MTVKELMKILETADPNAKVSIYAELSEQTDFVQAFITSVDVYDGNGLIVELNYIEN